MNKYYIAQYSDNCCDEIDLEAVKLFTLEEKAEFEAQWKLATKPFIVSTGNWGEIEYKKGKQILNQITFKEISESTYNELKEKEIFEWTNCQFFPEYSDYLEHNDLEDND
jgi:hypothetical protein